MAKCEVCGNVYDKTFTVSMTDGSAHVFDSFECALHALALTCRHCGCRILGHGMETENAFYELVGTKGKLKMESAYTFSGKIEQQVTVRGRSETRVYPPRDQFAPLLLYFSDCILKGREPEPSGREGVGGRARHQRDSCAPRRRGGPSPSSGSRTSWTRARRGSTADPRKAPSPEEVARKAFPPRRFYKRAAFRAWEGVKPHRLKGTRLAPPGGWTLPGGSADGSPAVEAVMVKPVEAFPPRERDDAPWRIKLYKLRLRSAEEPSNAEGPLELRSRTGWKVSGSEVLLVRSVRKEDAHGTLRPAGSRV